MLQRLITVVFAVGCVVALSVVPTAVPAGSARAQAGDAARSTAGARWRLVVSDHFDSGGVPRHWHRYDGPYGSGPRNCARPDHAFVRKGMLHLLMRHEASGRCGAGWYSAGMKLDSRFESVDQKIAVRFRVRSVGGVRAHRIIPMRWPSSDRRLVDGEEDYCEGTPLLGCATFLHHTTEQEYHSYAVDLTRWHTLTFVRRGFMVRSFIDGVRRWTYRGTAATLPPTLKRPVLQQECDHSGCPRGRTGREVILIDWIKVWNPA